MNEPNNKETRTTQPSESVVVQRVVMPKKWTAVHSRMRGFWEIWEKKPNRYIYDVMPDGATVKDDPLAEADARLIANEPERGGSSPRKTHTFTNGDKRNIPRTTRERRNSITGCEDARRLTLNDRTKRKRRREAHKRKLSRT